MSLARKSLFTFVNKLLVSGLVVALNEVVFVHLAPVWWWACMCVPLSLLFNYGTKLLLGLNAISWLNRANASQPLLLCVFSVILFLNKEQWPHHTRLTLTYTAWLCSFMGAAVLALLVAYRRFRNRASTKWRFQPEEWRGTVRYGSWLYGLDWSTKWMPLDCT